jgi:hypothetical protein
MGTRPIPENTYALTPLQKAQHLNPIGKVTPHGAYKYPRPTKRDPGAKHPGVDLAGAKGTPILSPTDGVITDLWYDDTTKPWSGYGPGGMMIEATDGTWHLLGHMDPDLGTARTIPTKNIYGAALPAFQNVPIFMSAMPSMYNPAAGRPWKVGDRVSEGDLVGFTSGLNHVHWEVRSDRMWTAAQKHAQITIDPLAWLAGKVKAGPALTPPPAPPPAAASGGGMGAIFLIVALVYMFGDRKRKRG